MKAKILFIGLVASLFSCSGQQQAVDEEKAEKKVVVIDDSEDNEESAGSELNIHLEKHIKYCGGAAPGENQLNNYQPYAETTFYLTGDGEPMSFTTDAEGNATIRLEKGIYCLKTPERQDQAKTKAMLADEEWMTDDECLQDWFAGCDYDLELKGDTSIEITLRTRCYYDGPVPCITNLPAPPP